MPGFIASISLNSARWRGGGLLLAGGVALGLSFPPYPFPWLAWIALVPLVKAWDEAPSWSVALRSAFITFLATFAVAFSWPLFHAMPHVALASLNGMLLLPLWMSIPFGLSWLVKHRLGRSAGLAALAAFYLTMEAALNYGPLALPWPLLGHTQAEALLFNQFADLTGVPGLTLWVLLLNIFAYSVKICTGPLRLFQSAGLALLIGAALVYGAMRVQTLPQAEHSLQVGLVQPGSAPLAWANLTDTSRVSRLIALSDSLLSISGAPPELIVWPETAVPLTGDPVAMHEVEQRLQSWSDTRGIALLTGAVSIIEKSSIQRKYRNRAILFEPSQPVQHYTKRRLVPFAERVPFLEQWPWLEALTLPAGGVSGYVPGRNGSPLRTSKASIGVLICLESVFGTLGRSYAAHGADVLVTITQDGWWGRTAGYRQHLAFTRLRAIETRRAVAQVSVSGTTALIFPDGSIPIETGWMERVGRVAEIPLYNYQTYYSTHGDWVNWMAYLTALLFLMAATVSHVQQMLHKQSGRAYA